jgi:hypothetical protein
MNKMNLKTGVTIIKKILFLLVLIALLLPLGISAQSNQTSGNKPISTPAPTPDNTALINQLKDQLRNAENAYQNANNFLQSLSTNPYTSLDTIFQAQNNALYWLNKVSEYKLKLIYLGYYSTSVPSAPVSNWNNNYSNSPESNYNNDTSKKNIACGYCNGTGKCPFCNSAGQSLACVSNPFGVKCTDSYCIARNHRCNHCGGTHICSNCKGSGHH